MKKTVFLMAFACLLFAAASAMAQSKTDFSGAWTLDVSKSKVNGIESATMTVTQTDKDITYKSDIKRAPRPDNGGGAMGGNGGGNNGGGQGAPGAGGGGGNRSGMMGGGGGMGRGGMGGGNQAMTFTLDGKETTSGTAKMKSAWDGNKLMLTTTRSFTPPNGGDAVTMTTTETWQLADGGKTLTVHRESQTPNGNRTSDFYYTKQ